MRVTGPEVPGVRGRNRREPGTLDGIPLTAVTEHADAVAMTTPSVGGDPGGGGPAGGSVARCGGGEDGPRERLHPGAS